VEGVALDACEEALSILPFREVVDEAVPVVNPDFWFVAKAVSIACSPIIVAMRPDTMWAVAFVRFPPPRLTECLPEGGVQENTDTWIYHFTCFCDKRNMMIGPLSFIYRVFDSMFDVSHGCIESCHLKCASEPVHNQFRGSAGAFKSVWCRHLQDEYPSNIKGKKDFLPRKITIGNRH
jgi:hypothetical protein